MYILFNYCVDSRAIMLDIDRERRIDIKVNFWIISVRRKMGKFVQKDLAVHLELDSCVTLDSVVMRIMKEDNK